MTKEYIDADPLKKEIKRLKDEYTGLAFYKRGLVYANAVIADLEKLQSQIDFLQQEHPEVDWEEEYKTWWKSISGKINVEHIMEWYMHQTASHFYELGLKAKKED